MAKKNPKKNPKKKPERKAGRKAGKKAAKKAAKKKPKRGTTAAKAKKKTGKRANASGRTKPPGRAKPATGPAKPGTAGAAADLFDARPSASAPPAAKPTAAKPAARTVSINRAPVLTLWAAVVAERLGYDRDAALTLGKCVSGLNAQSKGRRLGIFGRPKPPERGGPPKRVGLGEEFWVEVCGRPVPAKTTEEGVRAVVLDRPIDPDGVRRYLSGKFGEALEAVRDAMTELAGSYPPDELHYAAYSLYERFRPQIEPGRRGWGQKGTLDLGLVRSLAHKG